jgi:Mn2+/Fe2+ NRAMP family transporter
MGTLVNRRTTMLTGGLVTAMIVALNIYLLATA